MQDVGGITRIPDVLYGVSLVFVCVCSVCVLIYVCVQGEVVGYHSQDGVCVCVQGEVVGYHSQAECQRLGLDHHELLKMMKIRREKFECNNVENYEFDGEDLDDEDREDSDNCCTYSRASCNFS